MKFYPPPWRGVWGNMLNICNTDRTKTVFYCIFLFIICIKLHYFFTQISQNRFVFSPIHFVYFICRVKTQSISWCWEKINVIPDSIWNLLMFIIPCNKLHATKLPSYFLKGWISSLRLKMTKKGLKMTIHYLITWSLNSGLLR